MSDVLLLADLLDLAGLEEAIAQGYVRRQGHPELPLSILNYTERCQYERAWTDVTRQCRGLVVDASGTVVARAYRKFFNYGEGEARVSLDEPAEVTDKADGSLGICYPTPGGWAVATRGSFTSEQALHATAVLRDRYAGFAPPQGMTVLWEVIYPANRIVCDYGGMDDLVLLGAVDTKTGCSAGPRDVPGWTGPAVEVFPYATLADALAAPPRPGREGLVVHFPATGDRLKLKQADYVALHRVLTQTTARTVWEFLAVNACKHLITVPKHWGSRLGVDPERAAEVLAAGDGWLDGLLSGVPDEFHAWLRATAGELAASAEAFLAAAEGTHGALMAEYGGDRRAYAGAVRDREDAGALFLLYDGRDITAVAWKAAYPEASRPFAGHGEDAA